MPWIARARRLTCSGVEQPSLKGKKYALENKTGCFVLSSYKVRPQLI